MDVPETSQRNDQSHSDMAQDSGTGSQKKFFVILAGKTNDAHLEFVAKLESIGHTAVNSPEESDYLLVFCPVASRVGTDVSEALEKLPGGKPAILVVMHHTFNPDQVVAESRKLVNNPNVELTVDCLFYDDKLLKSNRNYIAWIDVQKYLGVSKFLILVSEFWKYIRSKFDFNLELQISGSQKKFFVFLAGNTNDHLDFVAKLESIGQTEVKSPEESDYLLVFCASRVGTDDSEALKNLPGGKPAILVVMHHTFDPDQVLPDSRRLVDNPNVELTVDCLFYEGKLLKSNRNYIAWIDVQKYLGVSKISVLVTKFINHFKTKLDSNLELQISAPQKNFFVFLEGKTNDAHLEFVAKLESIGQTEVNSPEESDYILVFCPVASRVGTDVREALEKLPGGKPAILVVMHHTYNPNQVLAESSTHVNNPNVELTVDCLFYEGKLLKSNRNYIAWIDVQKYLGVSKVSTFPVMSNTPQKKFFVILAGKTNDAHLEFVAKLESIGHTEVNPPEESDYLLVFCPVASRVGTDVREALDKLPDGKPAILVVMHHTFDPDQVLAESRRLVNNPNVELTVDCLFYEDKLLKSNRNESAWIDVQKYLGVPKESTLKAWVAKSMNYINSKRDINHELQISAPQKKFFVILAGKTNDAHLEFVAKLESIGHTEVNPPEESDYLLVFCPVASRVGTDVREALDKLPDGKPAILVVMHHTFDPNQVLAESSTHVNNPNVELTVDCLFFEDKLLKSNRNYIAWIDVQKYLGVSKVSTFPVMSNTPQKKFFVILAGKTNDAHLEFVAKLESIGHTEVNPPEESDYLLVFCPVASRVGTDVREALDKLPDGKPAILVVMHHTFDPDQVLAESRRLVNNPNVELTVDCLFYEDKLLKSNRNESAWIDVQKYLGVPKESTLKAWVAKSMNYINSKRDINHELQISAPQKKFFVILAGKTNDAHLEFVAKLESIGHTEVNPPEESDYLLVFCPVASRVGTDVREALDKLPDGKPAILVVMHHTSNPDQVLAESRRLVDNPNVKLTVDCLFNNDKLLTSNRNDSAWFDVQKYLGVSKVKFLVILAGRTNDAHLEFVGKLKRIRQTEVNSLEESDYLLVFCPVASRVGMDVSEALKELPGGKPAILVVMHHTFNPDQVLAESRKLVNNPNVKLTVDCLFYEDKLLKSNRNDTAWIDVQKYLGVPKVSTFPAIFGFPFPSLSGFHKQ